MSFLRVVSEHFPAFSSPDKESAKAAEHEKVTLDQARGSRSSAALIETEIPHCCFYCTWCGAPILLPHDSLGLVFGGPLIRRIEARSIGTVCAACGHAGAYSLFRGGHGYNTRHKFVSSRPTGKTVLLDWIRCDEPTCVFPLPVFALLEEGVTDAEIKELAARWIWDDLKCTAGHGVRAPRWLFDATLHRMPIDLTRAGARQPR
ncbi:MAG: hypothetical protein WBV28_07560 [Terracidiphilus sp.]